MKQIIDVSVKTKKAELAGCKTDMLVVGRCSDAKALDPVLRDLDKKLGGAIGRLIKLGDFKGKPKTHAMIYGAGKIAAERV